MWRRFAPAALLTLLTLSACDSVDEDRIPAMPVQIVLANPGLWTTYGVFAYGQHRDFIRETRTPANFAFTETTYTGYGGVLLIMGMDPFGAGAMIPLAYDLSCPVECQPNIRVAIDENTLEAVCPVCNSHYDVTVAGGAPTAGPALTGDVKYGLQRYRCVPADPNVASYGYTIIR